LSKKVKESNLNLGLGGGSFDPVLELKVENTSAGGGVNTLGGSDLLARFKKGFGSNMKGSSKQLLPGGSSLNLLL
jgi:hypothetical protein